MVVVVVRHPSRRVVVVATAAIVAAKTRRVCYTCENTSVPRAPGAGSARSLAEVATDYLCIWHDSSEIDFRRYSYVFCQGPGSGPSVGSVGRGGTGGHCRLLLVSFFVTKACNLFREPTCESRRQPSKMGPPETT